MFHTRFWEDNYVSNLDPIEKLLFIYALTNPRVSLCGIYEVSAKAIALDTGIDKEMLPKIFRRFEKDNKVVYSEGWMCVVNYPKYQNYNKTTMATALEREISLVPKKILDSFIGYGYPIATLSIGYKDKEQERDKVKDKEEGEKNTKHPSLEEVKEYCKERKNNVDPERFLNYYASNGWRVGRNPMKDWKAAVRTWERNDTPKSNQVLKDKYAKYEQ